MGIATATSWLRTVGMNRQVLGLSFAMVCAGAIIVAVTDPIAQAGDPSRVVHDGGGKLFRAALECTDGLPSRLADVRAANSNDARQSLTDIYPGCRVQRLDKRSFSVRYF